MYVGFKFRHRLLARYLATVYCMSPVPTLPLEINMSASIESTNKGLKSEVATGFGSAGAPAIEAQTSSQQLQPVQTLTITNPQTSSLKSEMCPIEYNKIVEAIKSKNKEQALELVKHYHNLHPAIVAQFVKLSIDTNQGKILRAVLKLNSNIKEIDDYLKAILRKEGAVVQSLLFYAMGCDVNLEIIDVLIEYKVEGVNFENIHKYIKKENQLKKLLGDLILHEDLILQKDLILQNVHFNSNQIPTVLIFPVTKGCKYILELLLTNAELSKELEWKDACGQTLLHLAARYNHSHIVKTLIYKGADVRATYLNGTTPLHAAVVSFVHMQIDRRPTIEALLEGGAEIDATNHNGHSALHLAICLDYPLEVIKVLISKKIDIYKKDTDGFTVIHVAASIDKSKAIRALLDLGMPIDMVDGEGNTALYLAALWGRKSAVISLLNYGASLRQPLTEISILKCVREQEGALQKSIPILEAAENLIKMAQDSKNFDEKAAQETMNALKLFDLELFDSEVVDLEVFDSKPFDLKPLPLDGVFGGNGRLATGKTALHLAFENKHYPLIRLLVKNGADVEIADKQGKTVLALAEHCEDHYSTAYVNFLKIKQMLAQKIHADLRQLNKNTAATLSVAKYENAGVFVDSKEYQSYFEMISDCVNEMSNKGLDNDKIEFILEVSRFTMINSECFPDRLGWAYEMCCMIPDAHAEFKRANRHCYDMIEKATSLPFKKWADANIAVILRQSKLKQSLEEEFEDKFALEDLEKSFERKLVLRQFRHCIYADADGPIVRKLMKTVIAPSLNSQTRLSEQDVRAIDNIRDLNPDSFVILLGFLKKLLDSEQKITTIEQKQTRKSSTSDNTNTSNDTASSPKEKQDIAPDAATTVAIIAAKVSEKSSKTKEGVAKENSKEKQDKTDVALDSKVKKEAEAQNSKNSQTIKEVDKLVEKIESHFKVDDTEANAGVWAYDATAIPMDKVEKYVVDSAQFILMHWKVLPFAKLNFAHKILSILPPPGHPLRAEADSHIYNLLCILSSVPSTLPSSSGAQECLAQIMKRAQILFEENEMFEHFNESNETKLKILKIWYLMQSNSTQREVLGRLMVDILGFPMNSGRSNSLFGIESICNTNLGITPAAKGVAELESIRHIDSNAFWTLFSVLKLQLDRAAAATKQHSEDTTTAITTAFNSYKIAGSSIASFIPQIPLIAEYLFPKPSV